MQKKLEKFHALIFHKTHEKTHFEHIIGPYVPKTSRKSFFLKTATPSLFKLITP